MNRLWEGKGEGVDMGAAWVKLFPHQMVHRTSKPPRPKPRRPLQHMHRYARASSWTLQHMHIYARARWIRFQCFCTNRLQSHPFLTKLGAVFSSRRDASVCKASAQSELTEGRFQCFFTNRLQFRPFSTKLVLSTSSRRDASVC